MNSKCELNVNVCQVLNFFDQEPEDSRRHATAIVAVAGEDLGIGLLTYYLRNKGKKVTVLPTPCTQKTMKGPRLDCWIYETKGKKSIMYQVEVKNWSAHATDGKPLSLEPSTKELKKYKINRWNLEWDGTTFQKDSVRKVLIPMKQPLGYNCPVEPLICFWWALHPEGKQNPFFSVEIKNNKYFKRVWVFSMSSYLRSLPRKTVKLEMPAATKRLQWLRKLFQ